MKDQSHSPTLLIVEDSDEYFEVLSRIIMDISDRPLSIHRCIDGDDALDYLNHEGIYHTTGEHSNPDLVLLDLNLPGTDGREVLVTIDASKHLKTIPIVVLTTSSNPKDIQTCYESGVNSYLLKPMKIDELRYLIRVLLDYWFKVAILPTTSKVEGREY
ncbi:response regulator [Chamaesiphon minutus]|uniref:Response regulator with CheY-like receiver domain and winged-helix DNA-binding domain n=1 Tax=Chamaesiphon minutus (strain ATCC 27169 / PCC 6605) TaxID=1173020 RepID=K9UJ95_CHAP6|nr:response regulator [Chamaesiphon minutus]AFY94875.1 response regulator with CheY-like receiver domain and winged-helix DNA-binding domain [Chamaesiphon minutus PCC 6605]